MTLLFRKYSFGLLFALLLTGSGCGGTEGPGADGSSSGAQVAAEVEEWALSDSPLLEIGVREGDDAYQLHRAGGSVRLEDGRIVVANAGSHELRFYDGEGVFLKAVGGDGEGPGEFRYPARLRRVGQDSLMVWDQRLQRASFFDLHGEFLGSERVIPTSDVMFPGDEWLLGRLWIDSPLKPSAREPIRNAAQGIPLPDSLRTLLFLKVTGEGRIWASEIRPPADTAISWTVYDLDGVPVARVETPGRFEPHEIGSDYLLGRFLDEVDVNYIRMYALQKPDGSPPGPGLDTSPPASNPQPRPVPTQEDREELAPLKNVVKNLASLEEIYYSDNYSYTTDGEALFSDPRSRLPDGIEVTILFAGREGWMGTVTNTDSGRFCALAYGSFVPMGWNAGEVICP